MPIVTQPTKLFAQAATIECRIASRVNDQGDLIRDIIKEFFSSLSLLTPFSGSTWALEMLLILGGGVRLQKTSLPERPQGFPNSVSYQGNRF